MKKKATKKLVLAKETIRRIENSVLGQIAGGTEGTTDYCGTGNLGCELGKIARKLSIACE